MQIASLVDGSGAPLYPNLSGSFSVQSTASVVSSWPTGSNAMANATVTVSFAPPGLTYTDPINGASATITSGALTFNLISTFNNGSSAGNWTLQTETSTDVPASSPLSWTVTRANNKTRDVTLSGYRHVLWNFVRSKDLTVVPTVNTLAVSRTIDGAPLSNTTSPAGVAADPANPTQLYTNWLHVVDGGPASGGFQTVWNRYVAWQVTYDYAHLPFFTVNSFGEVIYITRSGKTTKTTSIVLGSGDGG